MAAGNEVKLVGNLTRDPELRFTPSGAAVVNFGIAHNRRFQRNDEWQEEKSFFDIVAFGSLAEHVAESCTKGMRVIIGGRLQQRSWETKEDPPQKRSKIEVVADEIGPDLKWGTVEFTKAEREGGGNGGGGQTRQSAGRQQAPPAYDPDEEPF